MAYRVVSGLTAVEISNAIATASWDGWLAVGSVGSSGSAFIQLMTRGDGRPGLTTQELTQTLNSSFTSSAVGPWAFPYPSGSFGIPGLS